MRLPRDLGGEDLVGLPARYGYRITRQTGNHLRLTSTHMGVEHHVTVPKHTPPQGGHSRQHNERGCFLLGDR